MISELAGTANPNSLSSKTKQSGIILTIDCRLKQKLGEMPFINSSLYFIRFKIDTGLVAARLNISLKNIPKNVPKATSTSRGEVEQ